MLGEFLFAIIGLSLVALLMQLVVKQKKPLTVFKSVQLGLIILIVIVLLLLLLKR
jgi:hypothetical protein